MKEKILFLKPYFDYKIWGGKKLQNFGYVGEEKIGEALMISALKNKESIVISGLWKGSLLSNVFESDKSLFGYFKGAYPLLTKIIDANDDLSVQVHPNNEYAIKNFNKLGKTECWYILDCPKDAKIVYGSKENDIKKIEQYIELGHWDKFLKYEQVKKGDVIYVPSGTIHAITKGILTYEIQQSSDLTFRLFDYNRIENDGNPRELHIQDSLNCIEVNNDLKIFQSHDGLIIDSSIFKLRQETILGEKDIYNPNAYWLECLVIEGQGTVENQKIKQGDAFIITHNNKVRIIGNLKILISYIEK